MCACTYWKAKSLFHCTVKWFYLEGTTRFACSFFRSAQQASYPTFEASQETFVTTKVTTTVSKEYFILKTFPPLSDSPVGIQHDHTRPSGTGPDPGCRYRTRSLCCSTCHRGNAPCPRTGSSPWQRRIHHSTDQNASLWSDPARKRHGEVKFGFVWFSCTYNTDDGNEGIQTELWHKTKKISRSF